MDEVEKERGWGWSSEVVEEDKVEEEEKNSSRGASLAVVKEGGRSERKKVK